MPRPCHATTMPFWKQILKATHSQAWAWHVWIRIGRPETACGRPVRFRLLPATMRSFTKVIRSIPIRYTVGQAVRIFPATTRTFTKDTALSENGRGAAGYVWINAAHVRGTAWARHGRCEFALTQCLMLAQTSSISEMQPHDTAIGTDVFSSHSQWHMARSNFGNTL
jgi:hypothetical protein